MKKLSLSFVMAALNEENNIRAAIESVIATIDKTGIDADLIVINDGSTDRTKEIIVEMMNKDNRITMIDHDKPHGVGGSFWEGVHKSTKELVVFTPGDNENDPNETTRYLELMSEVDIVIPFVFNKNVRTGFRRWLSNFYRSIINTTFGLHLNYTNGTVIYRRSVLTSVDLSSFGFLYQAELLIKLIRAGYLYAEVPCGLAKRNSGKSKAVTMKSLLNVIKGYLKLFSTIHFKDSKNTGNFIEDSATARRVKELI